MREIKFRAWDKTEKRFMESEHIWAMFQPITIEEENNPILMLENENDIILCQYTGSKDKYGVEIYEKDILIGFNGLNLTVCYLTVISPV